MNPILRFADVRPMDRKPCGFDADRVIKGIVEFTRDEAARIKAEQDTRKAWQRTEARETLAEIVRDFGSQTVQCWLNHISDNDSQFFDRR